LYSCKCVLLNLLTYLLVVTVS